MSSTMTDTDIDSDSDADADTDATAVSTDDARQLLIDLVSTPSPSGEERAAAECLVEFFETYDREVWLDAAGNVRAPADDSVLLTSHIDTVPGEIPVEVEPADETDVEAEVAEETGEDVLWGRGSVDATGPLAAMAAAAVHTGVSFVGVVGEETNSRGARHLVADREAPDAVVNGEPSGTTGITLGYRGFLSGTYVATSESGHTSRPEPNAIQHATNWWTRVESAFKQDEYQPVFERVTTKPVAIDGGVTDDGLSVEATLDAQLRVPPALDIETVRETAEAELEYGTVSWAEPIPPVMESPRTEVARAFRAAIRKEDGEPRLLRKTGTSDMNLYAGAWECPMATYGPGNSDLDHAPDERLSLAEFDQSVAVLSRVATTLTGGED
ncbi:acetylornithine deacetylase [Natrialba magadii ATCC 43099]|uniref:Putative [LysW]-lysine/[LysW]-ornithine hydrolase n=1 Tax=Natrialba magadii (strain ATCC 43099 / DSM 3394 / CCM 3739 / CIP 104546 / IAM 13178 / JCM 8861 / NBRC 102185 / NCIMB 2190 / MS3) TaxID=547559 RepID=D3SUS3_NATMM|nr:[LysW]-lysine hydrolase [Natrialba magadii]ADD05331.1 acetylornithine deacetylase [Natrialba magadii ATCC 43099]ELY29351.1 acetyl-lysine deacetylase [Natrialba magadii ATCC 43099]